MCREFFTNICDVKALCYIVQCKSQLWHSAYTDNLITMLRLLQNTIFSSAVNRASDIIQDKRTMFETLDTRLLDTLCDVNTDRGKT